MSWIYYVGRAAVWLFFFLLTRRVIRGKENIPSRGPMLIVANHLHNADPPLIGSNLRRIMFFMAKEGIFRSRLIAYCMYRFGVFPVNRQRLSRSALRQAHQVLDNGQALAIFPEGRRSRRGHLEKPLPGSALIACRSGVPVFPVGITGTEQIKGVSWIFRRPTITVNIGSPFYLTPADGKLSKEELATLTDSIMWRIAELLPLEYRGKYQT